MDYFPIAVNLKEKKVLVIGAGGVAERKITFLLKFGAQVCVIAPQATAKINSLFKEGKISWLKRKLKKSDIKSWALVIAATNNSKVNEQASRLARRSGILINVVDKPAISDFISPAFFKSKQALIAVYTDAKNPVLSRDLKNYLKEKWDDFLSYRDRLSK